MKITLPLLVFGSFFVTACGGAIETDLADESDEITARTNARGGLYMISNETTGNRVLAYSRGADGSLTSLGAFATGGFGSGNGLGSQGSVILHLERKLLLAVNPGSDELTSFRVQNDGTLVMASIVPTDGARPVSVTAHDDLVYVLNGGGAGSISGFRLDASGALTPIADSTRPLSGGDPTAPAQIEFTPGGALLMVTEKATNVIDTYTVHADGTASDPLVTASSGATPFGFAFARHDRVIVTEAFGGEPGQSAVSSYNIRAARPAPAVISASIPTTQTAACWVAIPPSKRFAYATNTGSASVSSYSIAPDGSLQLIAAVAGVAGRNPIDVAMSKDGQYLYAVNGGSDDVNAYRVEGDGSLTPIAGLSALPSTTLGLAVR